MLKKILTILLLMLSVIPFTVQAIATNSTSIDYLKIYLVTSNSSKEGRNAKKWLENYQKKDNKINLEYLDTNNELYKNIKNELNIKKDKIPLIIIGSNFFYSFNDKMKVRLNKVIKAYENEKEYCDIVTAIKNDKDIKSCLKQNKNIYHEQVPIYLKIILASIILIILVGGLIVIRKLKRVEEV